MSKRKRLLILIFGLFSLCILAAGFSALSNRNLPTKPEETDFIAPLDKIRLSETIHLKNELGEAVWPGWGEMTIPILLWTEETSFLVEYPAQPTGWDKVEDDTFKGQPYYRQDTEDHENFAVIVEGRWVASLATKWEMDNFMISQFRDVLPSPINKIIPYRIFIQPSEVQITGVLHETFHVYQAVFAPDKLEKAEDRYQIEDKYWVIDENMGDEWSEEVDLLAQALEADTHADMIDWVRNFLEQRENRREMHGLDEDSIQFERLIEWEEGLAKYVEVAIWQQAYSTSTYQALPDMALDEDFKDYDNFEKRWKQEIMTMKNQADHQSDTRFYYTGMAQAFLLDRLMPGWKERIMLDDVWLDELMQEAVSRSQ